MQPRTYSFWTPLASCLLLLAGRVVWAQQSGTADAAATEAAGGLGALFGLVPYGLMFLVVYFLLFRPANKARAEQQQMLAGLKKDDEVVTQSGLIGRIVAIEDTLVVLEVADKVKVRMLRDRISGPFVKSAPAATKATKGGIDAARTGS